MTTEATIFTVVMTWLFGFFRKKEVKSPHKYLVFVPYENSTTGQWEPLPSITALNGTCYVWDTEHNLLMLAWGSGHWTAPIPAPNAALLREPSCYQPDLLFKNGQWALYKWCDLGNDGAIYWHQALPYVLRYFSKERGRWIRMDMPAGFKPTNL